MQKSCNGVTHTSSSDTPTGWTYLTPSIRQNQDTTERRCAICGQWKPADVLTYPRNTWNYAETHSVCLACVPSLDFGLVSAELDELEISGKLIKWRNWHGLRNDYVVHDDYVGIQAYNPKRHKYHWVVVDHDDWSWLKEYSGEIVIMSTGRHHYAYLQPDFVSGVPNFGIRTLHSLVAHTKDGQFTDHLNGCGTDNRKLNVRSCLPSDNSLNKTKLNSNNKSGYRGVQWTKKDKCWRVVLSRKVYGTFSDYIEACRRSHDAQISAGIPNVQPVPTSYPAFAQMLQEAA